MVLENDSGSGVSMYAVLRVNPFHFVFVKLSPRSVIVDRCGFLYLAGGHDNIE